MDYLAIVVGVAVFLAAGTATTAWLGPSLSGRAGRLGLALVLGPGVVAWLLFLWNLVGVPLGRAGSVAVVVMVTVALILTRRRSALDPVDHESGPLAARVGLALLFAVPIVIGVAFAVTIPPVKDSLANWSLKTLVLFEDGSVFTDELKAEHRYHFHKNYPLLGPLAQVFLYGIRGEVMDAGAKVVFSLVHLGVSLLLVGALRGRLAAPLPLLFGALLAATPHFYGTALDLKFAGSAPSGYAEPMFAALAGATAILVALWLIDRRPGDLRVAALLLGLALFTKNEGMPLALALGLGAGVGLLLDRRRGLPAPRELAIATAILVAVAGPWMGFRATLPAEDENYQEKLLDPEILADKAWRAPTILVFSAEEALGADHHGMAWPLLLMTLLLLWRRLRAPENAALLVTIGVMASVYAAVFVVTPLPIVDSLYTSIPRTYFHMTPVALALVGFLMAADRRDAGAR